jgi:formamidopyrimidine-DNA glycosylase
MWAETARDGVGGPRLGIHLGLAGWLVADDPAGGAPLAGGEPRRDDNSQRQWLRFALEFAGGGHLWLYDKRRLARVRLEPDIDRLGPDVGEISRADFRARVGRGQSPVKARLLDQSVLAGVGNQLADETLWRARLSPSAPAGELSVPTRDGLRRTLGAALRSTIDRGGVHTGEIIPFRHADAACPRCGAHMSHGTVRGRSTRWCSAEQV